MFLATSPVHRDFKLKMAKEEIIKRAVDGIKIAREKFEDVEFSTEDAARTELEFLAEVVERAIEAGATTLNIPDTVLSGKMYARGMVSAGNGDIRLYNVTDATA